MKPFPKVLVHCHHEICFETATEPISVRKKFIRENKSAHEIPTRIRLLKVVKVEPPKALLKLWNAYNEAQSIHNDAYATRSAHKTTRDAFWEAQTRDAFWEAHETYKKALATWLAKLTKNHAKYCPAVKSKAGCPWDGHTIF